MASKKGYENTISKVVDQASKDMFNELEASHKEALNILGGLEADSKIASDELVRKRKRESEVQNRQVLGAATIEARSRTMKEIDEAIKKVFSDALEQISSRKQSKAFLTILVEECIEALGSKNVVLSCGKRDIASLKTLVAGISKEKRVKIKVNSKEIKTTGGVYSETQDGSARYDNTFEARIERLKPELRGKIVSLFTGDK